MFIFLFGIDLKLKGHLFIKNFKMKKKMKKKQFLPATKLLCFKSADNSPESNFFRHGRRKMLLIITVTDNSSV